MIFVDTGAFLARFVERDQYHERAVHAWRQLEIENPRILTSHFVLDEVLTLLGRRTSYAFAAQKGESFLTSDKLEILRVDEEIELGSLRYFEKFADQKISYTDCTSFELMRSQRIERVFSFDRHFALAGFTLWPS